MEGPTAGAAEAPDEARQTGTVKWFDAVRGYGFVAREGKVDVFVHASAVEGAGPGEPCLVPGQRVSFEVAEGARGLQARRVRPAPVDGGGEPHGVDELQRAEPGGDGATGED